MGTYKIEYNRNGKKVSAKSRAKNAKGAFDKYANRPVFGGDSIFFSGRTKLIDADTRGEEWAEIIADKAITVSVTKI